MSSSPKLHRRRQEPAGTAAAKSAKRPGVEMLDADRVEPRAAAAPGGPAALRGFRLQALYSLHRLLSNQDDLLQPEGVEDLAIFRGGALSEACQVKAHAAGLAVSDLDPQRSEGYFRRSLKLVKDQPSVSIRLVTFGVVGPELRQAVGPGAVGRRQVHVKLAAAGIGRADADLVLDRIEIEQVAEGPLTDSVMTRIRDMATGHDPAAALELLLFWIHLASEQRRMLDAQLVIGRLSAIGTYLAERSVHAAEWFTTIEPITESPLTDADRARLRDEFSVGIGAEFEHIRAGAAVVRTERLEALRKALAASRVAVVHGASGEGKTTLALSFLAELPESWRFRVRETDSTSHARSIARALLGHARALQVPMFVHLDVGPGDSAWPVLVRELSRNADVRVIVTIREEDWRRTYTNAEFSFSDIELSMTKDEAREIYSHLRERSSAIPPTFEDAWSRFGGNPGPLLEFVHLCTQGEGLRERLRGQVQRLQDDVRERRLGPEELGLLRLVSVAAAYEAAVDLKGAAQAVGLIEPMATIRRFEREYLLRTSTDGRLLVGLHSLRSSFLAELLSDPVLAPWSVTAAALLPIVVDSHIERFLLYALSRRPDADRRGLITQVSRSACTSWTRARGIVSALLWRGLADYAERNRGLIEEVQHQSPGFWHILIDWDVARVGDGLAPRMLEGLSSTHPAFAQAAERAEAIRARQSDPTEIFALVGEWLRSRADWPSPPTSAEEWAGLGRVMFWARRVGQSVPLDAIHPEAWRGAIQAATIEELADAAAGLAEEPGSPDWWAACVPQLLDKFRVETETPHLVDDGSEVAIEYLVDPDRRAFDANHESVWRLGLLRCLLPDRSIYRCQGHGHRLIDAGHDATVKAISAGNLPPAALPSLNGMFHNYTQRWFRVGSWAEFWDGLHGQRQDATVGLQEATRLITAHFRQRAATNRNADVGRVVESLRAIGEPLALPKAAIDEWGFVSESQQSGGRGDPPGTPGGVAIEPYVPLWRAYRDFMTNWDNFARNSADALVLYLALGQPAVDPANIRARALENGVEEARASASTGNLARAAEGLWTLQQACDRLLPGELRPRFAALAARERSAYDAALIAWRALVEGPQRRFSDVVADGRRDRDRQMRRLRAQLSRALSDAVQVRWTVEPALATYDDRPALLITGNWPTAMSTLGQIQPASGAIANVISALSEGDRDVLIEVSPTI